MQAINSHSFLKKKLVNKSKIIFFHIPKTGGSSIASGFRRKYRLSNFHIRSESSSNATQDLYNISPEDSDFLYYRQQLRQSIVFYCAEQDVQFITGHFCYDRQFCNLQNRGYSLITFLRNPVDRFISSYFYRRYKKRNYSKIYSSFEEYIDSHSAHIEGSTYVRFLGGILYGEDSHSREALERAKNNVSQFDQIGLLEHMDLFKDNIHKKFGMKLNIPHKRENPAKQNRQIMEEYNKYKSSKKYRDYVSEICKPDLELFEHIRQGLSS